MKKIFLFSMLVVFILTALAGCMNSDNETLSSTASKNDVSNNEMASKKDTADGDLDEYNVNIKSCRLAKDYEGKDIVIVKYGFTNNSNNTASFTFAINDKVFQNGVGLNKCYTAAESAKYSSDNQSKDIKNGASLDVEVAYVLNDSTTPIEVECSQLISLSDEKITKKFNIK